MKIELTPEQEAWLLREVAEGRYASVEEAVEAALSWLMAEVHGDVFDAELKALIDEGIADADAGRLKTPEEVMERVRAHLRAKA